MIVDFKIIFFEKLSYPNIKTNENFGSKIECIKCYYQTRLVVQRQKACLPMSLTWASESCCSYFQLPVLNFHTGLSFEYLEQTLTEASNRNTEILL